MERAADPGPSGRRLVAVLAPLALAAFQVAGTFGASREQTGRRDVDALAVALVVAGPLALWWLRRFPVAVLWFVATVTLGYLLAGYPYGPVVFSLAIALFGAVLLGHRVAAWLAAGFVYLGHSLLSPTLRDEGWSWGRLLGVGAWALVILIAGEVARVRRERAIQDRRAREEAEQRRANEERLRIARDLHDVVAHHMSLINVQAGVALHLVDRRPEQAQTALTAIKDASSEALAELRSLVGVLRDETESAPRAPASVLGSLDELVERSGHAGLDVRKVVEGDPRPIPAAVELAALRIVQEGITNVVRHSGARTAEVRLVYGADVLTVQVDDDGHGCPVGSDEGSGVRGMRERATALGGTLTLRESPNGGVRVRAELPLRGSA